MSGGLTGNRRCPFCGAEVLAHDAQCLSCGGDLLASRSRHRPGATSAPPSAFSHLLGSLWGSYLRRGPGGTCDLCGASVDAGLESYPDDMVAATFGAGFCPTPPRGIPTRWLLMTVAGDWTDALGSAETDHMAPWQAKMSVTPRTPWNMCPSCRGEFRVFRGEEQWGAELWRALGKAALAMLAVSAVSSASLVLHVGLLTTVLRVGLAAAIIPFLWWVVDQLRKAARRLRQTRPTSPAGEASKRLMLDLLKRASRNAALLALGIVVLGWLTAAVGLARGDQPQWGPAIIRGVSLAVGVAACAWWILEQVTEADRDRRSERDRADLPQARGWRPGGGAPRHP